MTCPAPGSKVAGSVRTGSMDDRTPGFWASTLLKTRPPGPNSLILHHEVEGAGRNVLLLHPVGLDLTFLAPLAALLAQRYRVMRMDLRGHGRSPATPLARGFDDYAADVHETLIAQRFAPCAAVGFSFGGMVAQTLAIRHPADVTALVASACQCTHTPESREKAASRATNVEDGGMATEVDAALARWFTPAFRAAGQDAPTRERLMTDDPRGWAQGWRAIASLDTLPLLATIRVPSLALAGEVDVSSPPAQLKVIADAIPGAQMTVIPGAPHMLFIEQPDAVARALVDFLG